LLSLPFLAANFCQLYNAYQLGFFGFCWQLSFLVLFLETGFIIGIFMIFDLEIYVLKDRFSLDI